MALLQSLRKIAAPVWHRWYAVTLTTAAFAPASAWAVSVAELPALVRSNNRDLQVAQSEINTSEAEVKVARARYLPTLGLKSTYTRLDKDIVLDIPNQHIERPILGGTVTIGIDVDPPPINIQNKSILMSNLVLTQPLYAGGRIGAGLDAANAGVEIARAQVEQTYRERLAEGLARYFQVKSTEAVLAVLRVIDGDLKNIAATAQAAVKAGVVPQFAVMQVQVAQVDLAAKITEAESGLKLASLAFKDSVGIDVMSVPTFDSPLVKLPIGYGLDVFKTKALAERTEFHILEQKAVQVEALKTAKTGEMLPTVFMFGAYNVANENLPPLTPRWAVGVELDIPLSAGLTQIPERERAASLAQKVSLLRSKAQAQIPLQVELLYDQCQAQFGELGTMEANLALTTEVQRLAVARLKSGAGSAVEVLKAAADRESMEVRRILLLEEYNRHLIDLYQAAGAIDRYVEAFAVGQQPAGQQAAGTKTPT